MKKLILVEGIIGSGKSTFLPKFVQFLKDKGYDAEELKEPVDEWQESGILDLFYSDIPKYAYEFHMNALKTIHNKFLSLKGNNKIYVAERSIFSVKHFFVENVKQYFTIQQLTRFNNEFYACKSMINPTLFIYLNTPLKSCMERIKTRGRQSEVVNVTAEYQNDLHTLHNTFFNQLKSNEKLIINKTYDFRYVSAKELDLFNHILTKIEF